MIQELQNSETTDSDSETQKAAFGSLPQTLVISGD